MTAEYLDIEKDVNNDVDFRVRVGGAAQHQASIIIEEGVAGPSQFTDKDLALANSVIRNPDAASVGRAFVPVVVYAAKIQIPSIDTHGMLTASDDAILGFVASSWDNLAKGHDSSQGMGV